MKRIVLLLLMICLAKLAGAQIPETTRCQDQLTNTDGIHTAAIEALIGRTEELRRENQSLRAQITALQTRQGSQSTAAEKATTAKVLFIVSLVAGILLTALLSGSVFSRESYPDSPSPETVGSTYLNFQSRITERLI